jgi:hypothetical protein
MSGSSHGLRASLAGIAAALVAAVGLLVKAYT